VRHRSRLRHLVAGLAAAVALLPTTVQALTTLTTPGYMPHYFLGETFSYDVSFVAATSPAAEIEVSIPDFMEIVEVTDGNTPPTAGWLPADCPADGAPYECLCTSDWCKQTAFGAVGVEIQAGLTSQVVRFWAPTSAGADPFPIMRIAVRLRESTLCQEPRATTTLVPSGTEFGRDTAAYNACVAPGLRVPGLSFADPIPLAPRQASGLPTGLPVLGTLDGSNGIQVNVLIENQTQFDAIVSCHGPEQPVGNFESCATGATFSRFATLTAPTGGPLVFPIGIEPLILYLKPNNANPIPGGVDIRLNLTGDPALTHTVTLPVMVEKAPTQSFLTGVTPTEVPPSGGTATLQVTQATNDVGGNEPRTAAWTVKSAEFETATGGRQDALAIIPAPVAPATWLAAGAGSQSDIPVSVIVPPSASLAFPSDAVKLHVFFEARHDVTAPSVAPTTTALPTELVVLQQGTLPTDRCEVWARDATLGVGGRTTIGLNLIHGTDPPVPVASGITWSLTPNLGATEGTGGVCIFEASDQAPPTPSISIAATAAPCTGMVVAKEVAVIELVHIELVADKTRVAPGGVVRLTGKVSVAADVAGLRFAVRLDRMLKPVRAVPEGRQGLVVRKLDGPIGATIPGAAFVDGAETQLLGFAGDLVAGRQGEFSLPLLVRAAGAGQTVRALVDVYYAADQTRVGSGPRATAFKEITIAVDPEFTEATLVGKVFHDKNGDGRQQPDELGIAKAIVAVSSGVYAVTDAHGRYHIARLEAGRHAVKLDPGTVPLGATLTTDLRREVTLTPGGVVRVNFGVHLPDLEEGTTLTFVAANSGLTVAGGRPAYRATFAVAADRSLTAVQGELEIVAATREAQRELTLPLAAASPFWTLVERAADGRTWVSSFALQVYERPGTGALVVPWGPRLLTRLVLPPVEALRSNSLVILGELITPATLTLSGVDTAGECRQTLGGEAAPAKPAIVRCDLKPRAKLQRLSLAVVPAADPHGVEPPSATLSLPVAVDPSVNFLVGLAGVEGSAVLPHEAGANPWFADAAGEFFYRGVMGGDWLVTAGADADARDLALKKVHGKLELRHWGGFAERFLAHDPRRVFRRLDPEEYAPTYGDDSVTVDERESGGRFFFRVEKGQSFLKWGGVNTAIDDAEVGRYVRSFYGLGGRLSLGEAQDQMKLQAVAFSAQPDSVAARDELTVTGGTLYFLGHADLVEGSLRVTLETLDEVSGLAIRATPLVEGADYVADHLGGRLVLDSALPYRAFGTSLTGDGAGGTRARLIVEYEYLPKSASPRDYTVGGRALGTLGPVSLGVTGVAELVGGGDQISSGTARLQSRYSLVGATLRLDLGDALRGKVELAHSLGGGRVMARSDDGGLTFDYLAAATGADGASQRPKGNAAAVELKTGLPGAHATAYGRYNDAEFTDSRILPGMRLLQGGLRLDAGFATGTKVWGNADYRETTLEDRTPTLHAAAAAVDGTKTIRDLGIVGVSQRLGDFTLGAEGRYEADPVHATHRTLGGGQLGYALTPKVSVSLRRRQLLAADVATRKAATKGESAVGTELQDVAGLDLALEAGVSDDAELFGRAQGSFPVADDTELYAGYRVASHLRVEEPGTAAAPGDGVVVGGRRTLTNGALLYSEQNLRDDGRERRLTRTVGGQLPLTPRTAMSLTYERGALDRDDSATGAVRDAMSVGGTFAGERVSLRLVGDGRLDKLGAHRTAELGGQGRLEVRPGAGWVVALAGRGGSAFDGGESLNLRTSKRAWEGALGAALRPVDVDWLDLFARYALEYERSRDAAGQEWSASLSHIVAVAAVVDVVGPVAVSPKLAYRNTRLAVAGGQATDQALLVVLRGDLHLKEGVDATLEGRSCSVPQSEVRTRLGALVELSFLTLDWLRLGAGYNFSSISAYSVSCLEPGARGLFVRAEAVY
jgi:hypothetical protein